MDSNKIKWKRDYPYIPMLIIWNHEENPKITNQDLCVRVMATDEWKWAVKNPTHFPEPDVERLKRLIMLIRSFYEDSEKIDLFKKNISSYWKIFSDSNTHFLRDFPQYNKVHGPDNLGKLKSEIEELKEMTIFLYKEIENLKKIKLEEQSDCVSCSLCGNIFYKRKDLCKDCKNQ